MNALTYMRLIQLGGFLAGYHTQIYLISCGHELLISLVSTEVTPSIYVHIINMTLSAHKAHPSGTN